MPEAKVIGKVASTLEEIRGILDDKTPNKLHNTLKSILAANISMVGLMGELVELSKNDKKKVQLRDSAKIKSGDLKKSLNQTNNILVDIKGILKDISNGSGSKSFKDIKKSIENLTNAMNKKAGDIKLSEANSKKVLNKMLKQLSKGDNKMKRIMDMINIVSKLKEIKFSDLLKIRPKVKQIHKIYDRLLTTFRNFKDDKEIKSVNKFANDSVDIIKRLSKISVLSKPAKLGAKAIDSLFFGKFGLVTIFEKLNGKKREIKKAKKTLKDMMIMSGNLLLTSLLLTGVAILGPTAILGGVMAAAIVGVFGGVVWLMGKMDRGIKKGVAAMLPLTIAMILAGTGLLLLNKATKDLEWEQLGKAAAAIGGFALLTVVAGLAIVPIGLGSIAMGAMGLGLIAIGGGIGLFNAMVNDDAIEKVSYGIPKIFDAMLSIFGFEDGEDVSFGDGVMGIIIGCLKCGGVMFASAAIAMAGISLGIAGLALRSWNNFPTTAIDNVSYAIETLDGCLGLGLKENRHSEGGFFNQLAGLGSDILGFGSAILQFGKTFFGMGTILLASFTMGLVRESLEKWKDFDPTTALKNMKNALGELDDMLGLGLMKKEEEKKDKGFWGSLWSMGKSLVGGIAKAGEFIGSAFDSAATATKLGVIMTAVNACQILVKTLIDIDKHLPNAEQSMTSLKKIFSDITGYFFGEGEDGGVMEKIAEATGGSDAGFFKSMLGTGALHARLGVLLGCVNVVSKMSETIVNMKDVKSSMTDSINNVFEALDLVTAKFFDKPDNGQATSLEKVAKSIDENDNFLGFGGAGNIESQLEIIVSCVGIVSKVSDIIKTMSENTDKEKISKNISDIHGYMNSIVDYFLNEERDFDDAEDNADEFKDLIDYYSSAVKMLTELEVDNLDNIANKTIAPMKKIFAFLMGNTRYQVFDGDKNIYEKQDLKEIKNLSEYLPDIFENLADALDEIDEDYTKAFTNLNNISNSLSSMKFTNGATVNGIGIAISNLTDGLIRYSKQTNTKKIDKLNKFVKQLNTLSKSNNLKMFKSVSTVIDKINTIQIDKANALTDAFTSFSKINSFGSIFTDFKKQVDMFTDACIRLVDAINGNTDALTTTSDDSGNNTTSEAPQTNRNTVYISNVKELADMISQHVGNKNNPFGGIYNDSVEVDLRINGEGGDIWTIRRN